MPEGSFEFAFVNYHKVLLSIKGQNPGLVRKTINILPRSNTSFFFVWLWTSIAFSGRRRTAFFFFFFFFFFVFNFTFQLNSVNRPTFFFSIYKKQSMLLRQITTSFLLLTSVKLDEDGSTLLHIIIKSNDNWKYITRKHNTMASRSC